MATPLTDSINALTTYANSVTGESDTTLSDAVYTLAQGYGQGSGVNPLKYMYTLAEIFRNATFDVDDLELDFDGNSIQYCTRMFYYVNLKNIVIKNLTITGEMNFMFGYMPNLKTITFDNCTITPTNISYMCRNVSTITAIYGELDFSNVTTMANMIREATALTHMEIKANSIGISTHNWNYSPFDNETLVNIANALNPNVTGCTVTLSADCVANCSTITGTVTDGTFTADASGSVTLADFITNTKGWTLA